MIIVTTTHLLPCNLPSYTNTFFLTPFFSLASQALRSYSLNLLHIIGKTTLETYLMQHHIWLTSDAKSLLTLIPGWPKVNFILVTYIYFTVCWRLYKPMVFIILGFYILDYSLSTINAISTASIVILSLLLLY